MPARQTDKTRSLLVRAATRNGSRFPVVGICIPIIEQKKRVQGSRFRVSSCWFLVCSSSFWFDDSRIEPEARNHKPETLNPEPSFVALYFLVRKNPQRDKRRKI